jgi:hypothetical protein
MPFEYPIKSLKMFGMWVTEESSWRYLFACILLHIVIIEGSVVLQSLYFLKVKDFLDFTVLMVILPPCAGVQLETFIVHYNMGKIKLMMKMIRECLDEYRFSESYKKELMIIDKIYKFLLWNVFLLIVSIPVFSAIKHELIALIWAPFDLTIEVNYWLTMIYEFFVVFILANIGLSCDIFPTLFMCYIVILLQQLCERFESLKQNSLTNNRTELIKCIKFQRKIHEIAKILNSTFTITFLSRGFFSVCIFCTTIFALFLISDFIVLGRLAAFLLHMLLIIFVSCYYGTRVTEASQRISDSIMASDWIYEDKEYRQLIRIALEFSKRPIQFTAGGMFTVNLEGYLMICNSAYSMFCLYKRFGKK